MDMEDVTFVSSRAVRKRKAADNVDTRSSKRVQPKDEPSSDRQRGRDDEGGSDGDNAIREVGPAANEPEGHRAQKRTKNLEREEERQSRKQRTQHYILELEDAVKRNTHAQHRDRQILSNGMMLHTKWKEQHSQPYSIWTTSRDALLKRISDLEGQHPFRRVPVPVETLEKIANLENKLARQVEVHESCAGVREQKVTLEEQLRGEQKKNRNLLKEMQDAQNNVSYTARQQSLPSSDLQRQNTLQNAVKERDQVRADNEELKRQLRDLQGIQRDVYHTY